jgi:4-hydroxy-tetrahydrodipicolinate reductase
VAPPGLEFVGVFIPTEEKAGDVRELVGLPPVGVAASCDFDKVVALNADCHLFMLLGAEPGTTKHATERILRAGQDVCQTSLIPMCHPD